MAARVTLKAVNDELARRGHHARLERGDGYFYFWSEDAADWIDRTVRVETLNALTLDQWVAEFLRLKKVNGEMMKPGKAARVQKRGKPIPGQD
jgi:hypothetical protein